MLLRKGTLYLATGKHSSVINVRWEPALLLAPYGLTVPTHLFSLQHRKVEMAASRRGYPSPALKGGAFRRVLVNSLFNRVRKCLVRFKIYLVPDEQTVQFCRNVNAQVRRITDSVIVFSDTSPMIPHITLVTGELVPSQTFQALTIATKTLAHNVKTLTLVLSQPYIEPLKGRYVLCDIQENPALTEFRKSLSESILGTYLTTRDIRPYVPHLTLAHLAAREEQVEALLRLVTVIPQMVCAHIEISHVGPKGSCIDRIVAFNLHASNEELRNEH